ncbi:hypothetical protein [Streptomyces sp. Ag109_O5-10]|uniref:hypothetical protein n=1 Tax=Streptomyces sp. Ag109_O5-10 TaxID=1855349 RepID=UPI0008967250|nr:hypothetical protein [Streptomyces sp. Ag109_O5-10]SEE58013.1 hypothetical protein SAMN05216533_2813 [Streptomyces sp. Ag109_O5-10]
MLPRRTLIAVTAALVVLCGAAPARADDGWGSSDPVAGRGDDPYDDGRLDGVGNTGGTGGTTGNDDFDFLGPGGPDAPG